MKRKIGELKKFPLANLLTIMKIDGKIKQINKKVELCEIGNHIAIIQPIGIPLERIEVDARKVSLL